MEFRRTNFTPEFDLPLRLRPNGRHTIVIAAGAKFPDCPNHPKRTTTWKPLPDEDNTIRPMEPVCSDYSIDRQRRLTLRRLSRARHQITLPPKRSLVATFLEMVMQQCPNCWEPMSITANLCPHCGHSEPIAAQPPKRRLGYIFWLLFLLMLSFAVLLVRYLGILW